MCIRDRGNSLSSLDLIGSEVSYGADLNQDGQIGLLPSGDRVDYGSGTTSLYAISGVGHGIFGDGSSYLTPLKTTKGAAWSGNPIGIKVDGVTGGYDLVLETVGRKGTSYSEISVSSDGVVAKKGNSLSSLDLIGLEVSYGADLNQDGQIGLLPSGNRVDYGSGTTSIYAISGVGHGILGDGSSSVSYTHLTLPTNREV